MSIIYPIFVLAMLTFMVVFANTLANSWGLLKKQKL